MRVSGETAVKIAGCESSGTVRLAGAAHEFEAQMMKELLRPMYGRDGDDEEAGFGGTLADFAAEALGEGISRAGGFGIADRIVMNLSRSETECGTGSIKRKAIHPGTTK